MNNNKTQRNQGSSDKDALCFSFIQLGTYIELRLLSAKKLGELLGLTGRRKEGGEPHTEEAAKGFNKENSLQLDLVQGQVEGQ